MVRNLTLGKSMGSGIALILGLMLVVGISGYYGLQSVVRVMAFYQDITSFQGIISSAKESTDQYFLANLSGQSAAGEKAHKATFAYFCVSLEMI